MKWFHEGKWWLYDFEKKLGKQSNIGTMEDDIDDKIIKQQNEYIKLKNKLETNVWMKVFIICF